MVLGWDNKWFLVGDICRHFGSETQLGKFGAFSVQLMFWMQVAGSGFRFFSFFLWFQMYRLGAMSGTWATQLPADLDGSNALFGSYSLENSIPEHESAEFERMDIDSAEQTDFGSQGVSVYDQAACSPLYRNSSRNNDLDIEVRIYQYVFMVSLLCIIPCTETRSYFMMY